MKNMEYIERKISATLKEAARYFPVVCLTGPRQSGKSTLLRHLFGDYMRFTLEDLDVRAFAASDPVAFLSQTDGGMVLDEVQNVPTLLSYIQGIVDEHPERRFVLSGSSNFAMLRSVPQSLAGRAGVFELLPMSYAETAELQAGKTLDQLLYDGLYPAVCAGRNVPRFLYPAYVRTYLERDVRDQLRVKDMMQFNTFLRLCAGRIGSVFKAAELAAEVGVSGHTVNAWLSVLQASYVVMLLRPYSGNLTKRLVKSPKLYFCDTGLACSLLDIETPAQLARDKMRGHLFENFVVMEALKARFNNGQDNNLCFYRDSNGREIDLLMRRGGSWLGVEVKSSMTYSPDFRKALIGMESLVKEPVDGKAIVYAGEMENAAADIRLLNYRHLDSLF